MHNSTTTPTDDSAVICDEGGWEINTEPAARIPTITTPKAALPGAVIKWHGGKSYLAKRIVALMPRCLHYVEPYAGGLAVLLARNPEGVSEVVNDMNRNLMNFWKVLQDPETFEQFRRRIEAVPFAEAEWKEASESLQRETDASAVERAVWFFVACRQSLAGRMDSFAPLSRRRIRRGMNEQASAWLTSIEGLPAVHERLRRVVILNKPALEVMRQQDGPDTLFYCDPPYLPETRTAPDIYEFEMTVDDHRELLATLRSLKGKVMLSGYPSPLYEQELMGWTKHVFDLPNHAAGGATKTRETECLWCNF